MWSCIGHKVFMDRRTALVQPLKGSNKCDKSVVLFA